MSKLKNACTLEDLTTKENFRVVTRQRKEFTESLEAQQTMKRTRWCVLHGSMGRFTCVRLKVTKRLTVKSTAISFIYSDMILKEVVSGRFKAEQI